MINQNYFFTSLLQQIKSVIIKRINFKFENVSSTKLPKKKKKMITHGAYKVAIS